MSKKCRAYSKSKLGLEPADNRKAFYAGWEAAIKYVLTNDISQECVDETAKDQHDDIYDIWVEQGTCQENRQVAPSGFECPRCGHCCKPDWVGLTKDEVDSWELPVVPTVFQFAQFVEAKLKEKNSE